VCLSSGHGLKATVLPPGPADRLVLRIGEVAGVTLKFEADQSSTNNLQGGGNIWPFFLVGFLALRSTFPLCLFKATR
jgi:hypothetical protein